MRLWRECDKRSSYRNAQKTVIDLQPRCHPRLAERCADLFFRFASASAQFRITLAGAPARGDIMIKPVLFATCALSALGFATAGHVQAQSSVTEANAQLTQDFISLQKSLGLGWQSPS